MSAGVKICLHQVSIELITVYNKRFMVHFHRTISHEIVKEAGQVLRANRPDGLTVVAVVVVRVHVAGIEVDVPRVVRVVRIE